MPETVTINYGDGTTQDTGELDAPVEHEFTQAGTFTISATAGAKRGRTTVTGPGKYEVTATEAQPPNPEPNKPELKAVFDPTTLTVKAGDKTGYKVTLSNTGAAVGGVTGKLTLDVPVAQVEGWKRDGKDLDYTDDSGKTSFEYGPFDVPANFDESGQYELALKASAPTGDRTLTHAVVKDSDTLVTADAKVTVQAAAQQSAAAPKDGDGTSTPAASSASAGEPQTAPEQPAGDAAAPSDPPPAGGTP